LYRVDDIDIVVLSMQAILVENRNHCPLGVGS